jgi:hypothetical protein
VVVDKEASLVAAAVVVDILEVAVVVTQVTLAVDLHIVLF